MYSDTPRASPFYIYIPVQSDRLLVLVTRATEINQRVGRAEQKTDGMDFEKWSSRAMDGWHTTTLVRVSASGDALG